MAKSSPGGRTTPLARRIWHADWAEFFRGVYEYNVLRNFRTLPPRQAFVNVTYRCNARCEMCRIWEVPDREEIALARFLTVIDDPILRAVEHLTLSGGEPLLRPDLGELTAAIMERLPRLSKLVLLTNGLLPRRCLSFVTAIAPACRARGIRLTVSVSMDGVGGVNDHLRGVPGAFAKASETLRLLRDASSDLDLSLVTASVLCKKTLPHVAEYQEWGRSLNVEAGFQLIGFHGTYVSNWATKSELDFGAPERGALFSLMKEQSRRRGLTDFKSYYWNDMLHLYREGRPRRTPCPFSVDTIAVDALGDVYYCLSEPKIGNCFTGRTLSEIYLDKNNLALREKRRSTCCPSCNSACLLSTGLKKDAKRYLWFLLTGRT